MFSHTRLMCYPGKEMFSILDTWPPHLLWPKESNHMLLQGVPAYQSSVVYKNRALLTTCPACRGMNAVSLLCKYAAV